MSEIQIPSQREPLFGHQVNDFKFMFPFRDDLNLNKIDLTRGRRVIGRYKFSIWDTGGHRIDFNISQDVGSKGVIDGNRTSAPDPKMPDPLSNSEPVMGGSTNPGKQPMKPDWGFG